MANTFPHLLSHAQQSATALLGCLGYWQPAQRASYCRLGRRVAGDRARNYGEA